MKNLNPPIKLSKLATKSGTTFVVRDDMLDGGTKQRAAIPYLRSQHHVKEFVYASPFSGFAQIALAASCRIAGMQCTIFAEKQNGEMSGFTKIAAKDAIVRLYNTLNEAEDAAKKYTERSRLSHKLPLGFNDPNYLGHLTNELKIQWDNLVSQLGFNPKQLWLPVGSGTLAKVFRSIVPVSTKLMCVDIHVLNKNDKRIEAVRQLPNTQYLSAPEPFKEVTRTEPPIPSNIYYDAKLWQFVKEHSQDQDVWWNVSA